MLCGSWCDCGHCGLSGLSGCGQFLFTAVVVLTPAAVDNLAQTCTLSLGGEQTGPRIFLATKIDKEKLQFQSIFVTELNINKLLHVGRF